MFATWAHQVHKRTSNIITSNTLLAVQLSAQTFIHNIILFIDTSNNAWYNEAHWLIGTQYLLIIASNDPELKMSV